MQVIHNSCTVVQRSKLGSSSSNSIVPDQEEPAQVQRPIRKAIALKNDGPDY